MGELSKWLKQQANNEIWYDYYRKKNLKNEEIALKTNQLNGRKLNE